MFDSGDVNAIIGKLEEFNEKVEMVSKQKIKDVFFILSHCLRSLELKCDVVPLNKSQVWVGAVWG